jgi:hypothetical protein
MKDIHIDILYLVLVSFAVIGIIEWIKSLVAVIKAKNGSWKWPVASFIFSFVVAVFGDGGIFQVLTNFVVILAINEIIGYNMIVKTVFALIDNLTGGIVSASKDINLSTILNEVKNAAGGVTGEVPPPPLGPAVSLSSPVSEDSKGSP